MVKADLMDKLMSSEDQLFSIYYEAIKLAFKDVGAWLFEAKVWKKASFV
jgi:hypothetical protein